MKYQSELINEILEQRGHEKSSLHYESECIEQWIDENEGAYPKLCDYQSEWLNYIEENPIGKFPYETITNVTKATVDNVVPLAYKSAILKGQTLVNIHPKNYKIGMNTDTIFSINTSIDISLIKPNTKYFIRLYNAPSNICRIYFKPCDTTSVTFTDINNKYTIHTTKSDLSEYTDAGRIHIYTLEGTTATQADVENVKVIICEYQEGMENWDIPYFEGMQSVKMPVLTTTGKNLFDINSMSNINNWDTVVSSEIPYCSYKINLKPNTTYAFNQKHFLNIEDAYASFGINKGGFESTFAITHPNKQYNKTFTITTDDRGLIYLKLFKANTSLETFITELSNNQLQLEEGTQATSYEPYKTNILTVNEEVELGAVGEVQDTLNLLTSEVIERTDEITLDVTNVSVYTNGNSDRFEITSNIIPKNNQYILSDNSAINNWGLTVLNNYNYSINNTISYHANVRNFFIRFEPGLYTAESLKQKLIDSPLTLRYQLETPTIKTVDLSVTNQDGETLTKLRPIEGTMYIETDGTPLKPSVTMEIPVEATNQNLMSFIEE